jgi:hypothetical protein
LEFELQRANPLGGRPRVAFDPPPIAEQDLPAGKTWSAGTGDGPAEKLRSLSLNGDWSVKVDPNGNPTRELKRDVLNVTEQSRLPDATDCKGIGAAITTAPSFAAAKAEGGDISFWVKVRGDLQPCQENGNSWSIGRISAEDFDGFLILRKN